eukprot:5956593-Pleurochrysis_carterae.AAC.1
MPCPEDVPVPSPLKESNKSPPAEKAPSAAAPAEYSNNASEQQDFTATSQLSTGNTSVSTN